MNAIELRDVSKKFKGFTLDHINLILPSGCIMGLVGENGAGKSTLIKLIMGALHCDSGEINVLGQKNDKKFKTVKEDVGIVLSEPNFPEEMTAAQIQKMMGQIYRNWDHAAFEQYLERFRLPRDKKFKSFSRGMKMKLSIAAALSHQARLLILDEATAGLDPVARDEILDLFFEFTREENHSILVSSHIVSDLEKLCDYISLIDNGKLLFCEEKDRMLEQYAVYRCTHEQLEQLDAAAVKGVRRSQYSIEALVDRRLVPGELALSAADMEEIIVMMTRGRRQ